MSFLSFLTKDVLPIAGIAAAFASGGTLGILAGSFLATAFASQKGLLGGGLQKFFSSGIGQGLTTAVGVATIATSIASGGLSNMMNAGTQTTNAADAAAIQTAAQGAVDTTAQAGVPIASDMTANYPALDHPDGFFSAEAAIAKTPPGSIGAPTAMGMPPTNLAAATAGVQAQAGAANPAVLTGGTAPNGTPTPSPTASVGAAAAGPPGPGAPVSVGNGGSAPGGGFISKMGAYLGSNPTMAMMGGQALAGMGQGIMTQKSIQEQIAAQQWANMRWLDPKLSAASTDAAGSPINVPQGYLQRAQAVRSMVSGSPNGPPGSPMPTPQAGPVPTPAQTQNNPGGGPVPVYAMGATPRGGAI